MSNKLYRVTCKAGLCSTGITAYVVAGDPTTAYQTLRESLDERDIGFNKDRELDKIELIAEQSDYAACGTRLYLNLEVKP